MSSHNIVLPYHILPVEAPLTILTFSPLGRVVAWTYVVLLYIQDVPLTQFSLAPNTSSFCILCPSGMIFHDVLLK